MTATADEAYALGWETAARSFERTIPTHKTWPTPGALAKHLVPTTVRTPALDLIDTELLRISGERDQRLIITMPPQEGKSMRVARDFPLWWLMTRPQTPVVVASYGQSLANRNGLAMRRLITAHPELGLRVAPDNGSAHDWSLFGHIGGVFSVGIGGGLTGRPAGLMVIDDPIKDRKEADSPVFRQRVWDWWTDVASARLSPGAPVVIILTRWHDDDLAGRLLADADTGGDWQVLNIPAQADHDPAKGETDVLGRDPGEYMTSARGRTLEQWEQRKRTAGARTWAALYQGRPSAPGGRIFQRDWWQTYEQAQWFVRDDGTHVVSDYDDMLISWDMAFKDTESADYVAGGVWMRRGADAFLLDQVHGRMDFVETVAAFRRLAARWPQAVVKLVEDKANGSAVIASLRHAVPGIVPEEPHGGKTARASAVAPLVQAKNVWLPSPELCPWVGGFVEECSAFPTGKHDDQVDQMSQALNRLILQPLLAGEIVTVEDLMPELVDHAGYVPRF